MSERFFRHPNLLHETVPVVVDILGDTYPEMHRNFSQIHQIIAHENELYKALLASTATDLNDLLKINPNLKEDDIMNFPGFIPAYKELQTALLQNHRTMDGEIMFKLYDTYGLSEEAIDRLAEIEGLQLDRTGFGICLANARHRTKALFANSMGYSPGVAVRSTDLMATQNNWKYKYEYNELTGEYEMPEISAKIVAIERTESVGVRSIVLDQSAFYPESGGQSCDLGEIVKDAAGAAGRFNVKFVDQSNGLVMHEGILCEGGQMNVGDDVRLVVDAKRRTGNIQNHSGNCDSDAQLIGMQFITKQL